MAGNIIEACASPGDWLYSWQFLSMLGIITSWLFVSLVYMIGSLLDNVGLMARAKVEVFEIITTTIILALVLAIVGGACTFQPSAIGMPTSGNMFTVAENYLVWLRNMNWSIFQDLINVNNAISMRLSIMGGFTFWGLGVSAQPFAGLQPLMNIMNLFMNGVMICLIITIAQITALKFIEAGALNVLLPVGIICRSFPFTRQFGGSMIAIALGLYVFYPFMLVVDDAIMGTKSANPNDVPGMGPDLNDAMSGGLSSIGMSIATGGVGFILNTADIVTNYFVDKPITELGVVALAAFILPAINGVVFVAAVRDLSRILGQEVDVSSLTRMI